MSVSLGTSKRNKSSETEILGQKFLIERIGTDGDEKAFQKMFEDLDGKVDAFGLGGGDIYVVVGEKKYAWRLLQKAIRNVKTTPVLDGSGLKNTLEREAIRRLQREGTVDFSKEKVLLVSAVDRYGMAQALDELCPNMVYGDLMFGMGLPIPIKSYKGVSILGKLILPIITKLPQSWFYPTGEKQESRTPKFAKAWADATIICGDSLFVLRYAPDDLKGKTIITQSIRTQNLEWLKKAGCKRVITTTPLIGGETFATNVMEAVLVVLIGKPVSQIAEQDYLDMLAKLNWAPGIIELNP